MRDNREQLNNGGYSLVELIVVILMMGMISLMLVMFITQSQKFYRTVSADTELQTEANFAMNYIEDLAIEASAVESKDVTIAGSNGKSYNCKVMLIHIPGKTVADPESGVYVTPETVQMIVLEGDTGVLRFATANGSEFAGCEEDAAMAAKLQELLASVVGNKRKFLARYVETMEVIPPAEDNNYLTSVKLKLSFDGKEYKATRNVAGRNRRIG